MEGYSWEVLPIERGALGTLEAFVLDGGDVFDVFVRSYLSARDFARLLAAGRSVYLAVHGARRRLTDELAFFRRLQERIARPGPWLDAIGRNGAPLHKHPRTEYLLGAAAEGPTLVTSHVPLDARFPVIHARLSPLVEEPPFKKVYGTDFLQIDLSKVCGVGTFTVPTDGTRPLFSYTLRDEHAWFRFSGFDEKTQLQLVDAHVQRSRGVRIPARSFPVCLYEQSVMNLLAPQGRSMVQYLRDLRDIRADAGQDVDDTTLTGLYAENPRAQIEGLFVMVGVTAYRYASPILDRDVLELCYLGPTCAQTMHALA